NPPTNKQHYIHARYFPDNLEESKQEWGNKQNDMIGAFLFKISDLTQKGLKIVRNEDDIRILQKLVKYLDSISYYRDLDNGMWEENEEIHSSSVGACVAGLKKLKETEFLLAKNKTRIYVPEELIQKGLDTLEVLLPRESVTKKVDLALLSLIWPYEITTKEQTKAILENVEKHLVRERGVIRYTGDQYYNVNGEAEWTMGFPWLAIIYRKLGNRKKYKFYLDKSLSCTNFLMELPELYLAKSRFQNPNSPLGWAQSLLIVAME
ncbi:glycoside hydrolase family 15, partial [Candidatus Woesearchaeota archaeon]|nr:glycoside hydrolase family 15 [Candidatus Woesearchaeota archaeon]